MPKTSLLSITKRLDMRNLLDFALSLPDTPFVAKDVKLSGPAANVLLTCDLLEQVGRTKKGGAIWQTSPRHREWVAYHQEKYVTPPHVIDYILDPVCPATNFLVDGYEAVMGLPKVIHA